MNQQTSISSLDSVNQQENKVRFWISITQLY